MVPGIGPSADLGMSIQHQRRYSLRLTLPVIVLQARMFSYPDAARYRVGPNYQQLPCNRAASHVYAPYERDGPGTLNGNYGGDPNYVQSGLHPVKLSSHHQMTAAEQWRGHVVLHPSQVSDKDFEQPRQLWKIICGEPDGEKQFFENIVPTLKGIVPDLHEKACGKFRLYVR